MGTPLRGDPSLRQRPGEMGAGPSRVGHRPATDTPRESQSSLDRGRPARASSAAFQLKSDRFPDLHLVNDDVGDCQQVCHRRGVQVRVDGGQQGGLRRARHARRERRAESADLGDKVSTYLSQIAGLLPTGSTFAPTATVETAHLRDEGEVLIGAARWCERTARLPARSCFAAENRKARQEPRGPVGPPCVKVCVYERSACRQTLARGDGRVPGAPASSRLMIRRSHMEKEARAAMAPARRPAGSA